VGNVRSNGDKAINGRFYVRKGFVFYKLHVTVLVKQRVSETYEKTRNAPGDVRGDYVEM
jgi:hypothetical protein